MNSLPSVSPSRPKRKPLSPLAWVLILAGAFFVIFVGITGVLFLTQDPSGSRSAGKAVSGTLFSKGSVGVLELNGVIMDSKRLLKQIDRFEEDDQIKAMVIRLNSPGGAVAPSQEIYEALKRSKKPVVASMGSVAASGAYYIAMAAKKVFANPGTITGSIGVIMEFANLEKLYEWAKIKRFSIKTGKFKDAGAEYREMQPEERELLQGMVNDVLHQFKQAVADGRKLSLEEVTAVADGRIFSGNQAKAAKLVDELGTLEDAVLFAGEQGGIKGKPPVTYPESPRRKLLDLILEDAQDDAEGTTFLGGILSRLLTGIEKVAPSWSEIHAPGIYWLWSGAR